MGNWTAKVLVFIAAPLLAQNTNLTQPVVVLPKADNSQTGELRFRELNTNGVNYIGFKAPTTLAANLIWELPALDGAANDCIVTNGSGVLSFAACGGGGASLPVVDSTAIVKGSSDATKLMRFEVDGLTTATTRVLTIQDANHTVAGLEIGQTFTVKQNISESRSADFLFMLRNMSASGYAGLELRDQTDTKQAHFTWANSSATLGPSSTHISSGGPIRFYNQNGVSFTEVASYENIGAGRWTFQTKARVNAPVTSDAEYPLTVQNTGTNGSIVLELFNSSGTSKGTMGFQDTCVSGCADAYSPGSLLLRTRSTDKISFFTNDTRRMDIDGTAGITSFERITVLTSVAASNSLVLRNNDAAGLAGMGMVSNLGVAKSSVSWDNLSSFLRLTTFGADPIQFQTNGSSRVYLNDSGFIPNTTNAYDLGASSLRFKKLWVVDLDCSGTCPGTPPFSDATAIMKDNSDATKLLAFELSGLSTATTRTLTPQNSSYTIAGINIEQTFTATQTFQQILPSAANSYDVGSSSAYWRDSWNKQVYAQDLRIAQSAAAGFGTSFRWYVDPSFNVLLLNDPGGTSIFSASAIASPRTFSFKGNVYPSDSASYSLGADNTTQAWTGVYANGPVVGTSFGTSASINSGDVTFRRNGTNYWKLVSGGAFEPDSNDLYNIGSSSKNVNTLWVDLIASGVSSGVALRSDSATNGVRILDRFVNLVWEFQPSGHLSPGGDATYNIGTSLSDRVGSIYTANLYGTSVVGVVDTSGNSRAILSGSGLLLYDNSVVNTVSISRTTGVVDAVGFAASGTAGITFTATISGCQLTFTKGLLTAQTGTC